MTPAVETAKRHVNEANSKHTRIGGCQLGDAGTLAAQHLNGIACTCTPDADGKNLPVDRQDGSIRQCEEDMRGRDSVASTSHTQCGHALDHTTHTKQQAATATATAISDSSIMTQRAFLGDEASSACRPQRLTERVTVPWAGRTSAAARSGQRDRTRKTAGVAWAA
jgi:hypothetical protein